MFIGIAGTLALSLFTKEETMKILVGIGMFCMFFYIFSELMSYGNYFNISLSVCAGFLFCYIYSFSVEEDLFISIAIVGVSIVGIMWGSIYFLSCFNSTFYHILKTKEMIF